MLAAGILSVPTVAFEPNVVPGVANRLVAPLVSAAAVHFEATCRYFRNCHVTGVPVRREFFNVPARPEDARPTLLVFGGSQGAHAINQVVLQALPALMQAVPTIHIIHQTGEKDYAEAQAAYLQRNAVRRGCALHRRHAGSLRACRPCGLPLRRQHGRRNHGGRKAGYLRAPANRRR